MWKCMLLSRIHRNRNLFQCLCVWVLFRRQQQRAVEHLGEKYKRMSDESRTFICQMITKCVRVWELWCGCKMHMKFTERCWINVEWSAFGINEWNEFCMNAIDKRTQKFVFCQVKRFVWTLNLINFSSVTYSRFMFERTTPTQMFEISLDTLCWICRYDVICSSFLLHLHLLVLQFWLHFMFQWHDKKNTEKNSI